MICGFIVVKNPLNIIYIKKFKITNINLSFINIAKLNEIAPLKKIKNFKIIDVPILSDKYPNKGLIVTKESEFIIPKYCNIFPFIPIKAPKVLAIATIKC